MFGEMFEDDDVQEQSGYESDDREPNVKPVKRRMSPESKRMARAAYFQGDLTKNGDYRKLRAEGGPRSTVSSSASDLDENGVASVDMSAAVEALTQNGFLKMEVYDFWLLLEYGTTGEMRDQSSRQFFPSAFLLVAVRALIKLARKLLAKSGANALLVESNLKIVRSLSAQVESAFRQFLQDRSKSDPFVSTWEAFMTSESISQKFREYVSGIEDRSREQAGARAFHRRNGSSDELPDSSNERASYRRGGANDGRASYRQGDAKEELPYRQGDERDNVGDEDDHWYTGVSKTLDGVDEVGARHHSVPKVKPFVEAAMVKFVQEQESARISTQVKDSVPTLELKGGAGDWEVLYKWFMSLRIAPQRFENRMCGGYDYIASKFRGVILQAWLVQRRTGVTATPCPKTADGLCILLEKEFGRVDDDDWSKAWEAMHFQVGQSYRSFLSNLLAFVEAWRRSHVYDRETSACPNDHLLKARWRSSLPPRDQVRLKEFDLWDESVDAQMSWLLRNGVLKNHQVLQTPVPMRGGAAVAGRQSSGRRDRDKKSERDRDPPKNGGSKLKCFTCKKRGHKSVDCPQKKKPPGDGADKVDSSNKKQDADASVVCTTCEKSGHDASRCWRTHPELRPKGGKKVQLARKKGSKKSASDSDEPDGAVISPPTSCACKLSEKSAELPPVSETRTNAFVDLPVSIESREPVILRFYVDTGCKFTGLSLAGLPSWIRDKAADDEVRHGFSLTDGVVKTQFVFPHASVGGVPVQLRGTEKISQSGVHLLGRDWFVKAKAKVCYESGALSWAKDGANFSSKLVGKDDPPAVPGDTRDDPFVTFTDPNIEGDATDLAALSTSWKVPSVPDDKKERKLRLFSATLQEQHGLQESTEIRIGDLSDTQVDRLVSVFEKRCTVFKRELSSIACKECQHEIIVRNPKGKKELGRVRGPFMEAVDAAFTDHYDKLGILEAADGTSGFCSRSWYVLKDKNYKFVNAPGDPEFPAEAMRNYRKVIAFGANPFVIPDAFEVPDAFRTAMSCSGKPLYGTLDLLDAYHQFLLERASREYTTHQTVRGLRRYARLPQGVSGASQRMQRCISALLRPFEKWCVGFFDNIIFWAETMDELLSRLDQILERLIKFDARLKLKACIIGVTHLDVIGFSISEEGVRIHPKFRRGLLSMIWPGDRALVGSFARCCGWLRRHLGRRFADLQAVLLDYSNAVRAVSEEAARAAFEGVKELLQLDIVLKPFRHDLETALILDYSDTSVSAQVSQRSDEGKSKNRWHATHYLSRRLTEAERKRIGRDSILGETTALVWAGRELAPFLRPLPFFYVLTDSGDLSWLKSSSAPSALRARSLLQSIYDMSQLRVAAIPGLRNVTDASSRDPNAAPAQQSEVVFDTAVEDEESLSFALLPAQFTFVLNDFSSDEQKQIKARADVDLSGTPMITVNGVKRVIVPFTARKSVWDYCHTDDEQGTTAHLGRDVSLHRLLSTFWWPKIVVEANMAYRSCDACRHAKANVKRHHIITGAANRCLPNHTWSVDFAGPFQRTPRGNVFLFGVRDNGSPWRWYLPTPDATTKTAIGAFNLVIQGGVLPEFLASDNGPCFRSTEWKAYLVKLNIEDVGLPFYHPDPFIERGWRDWNGSLRTLTGDWDLFAPSFARVRNRLPVAAYKGYSALNLQWGLDLPSGTTLEQARAEVLEFRRNADEKNKHRINAVRYEVGDRVDVWSSSAGTAKLAERARVGVVTGYARGRKNWYNVRVGKDLIECAGPRLTPIPPAPEWFEGRPQPADFDEKAVDTEWSPNVDEKSYDTTVGTDLAYVDGGRIYIGRVRQTQRESITLQDVRVSRVKTGKKKKKKGGLSLQPLFISDVGEISSQENGGEPLAYHVSKKQILGAAASFLDDERLVIADV